MNVASARTLPAGHAHARTRPSGLLSIRRATPAGVLVVWWGGVGALAYGIIEVMLQSFQLSCRSIDRSMRHLDGHGRGRDPDQIRYRTEIAIIQRPTIPATRGARPPKRGALELEVGALGARQRTGRTRASQRWKRQWKTGSSSSCCLALLSLPCPRHACCVVHGAGTGTSTSTRRGRAVPSLLRQDL